MLDEYVDHTQAQKIGDDFKDLKDQGSVVLTNVTAQWNPDIPEPTLSNVSVRINSLSLTAIVGPVGCGKVKDSKLSSSNCNHCGCFSQSSFLQGLLGELQVRTGNILVNGRLSYASQEPWVFAASVRQNITFGLPYNRIRYNEVVRAFCKLRLGLHFFF